MLVVASLAAAVGCADSRTAPGVGPSTCALRLAADPAYDAVIAGAEDCSGEVRLRLRVATGDATSPTWNAAAESPVRVEGSWRLEAGGATRDVAVSNPGATPVSVVGLEWTADELDLGVDRLLHDGYQSWTYTGVEPIPDTVPEQRGTARHGGDDENTLGEVAGVSWWRGALADAAGRGLVVGADGGTVLKTYVAADAGGRRLRVIQGATGDAIVLEPGERRTLDGLFLAIGDLTAGLDAHAVRVAALHPPPTPRRPGLRGWGSWNLYYGGITAALLREEATWVGAELAPLGLRDLLLDDGYEPHWGSWRASDVFGADLATLAAEQSSAGLAPAIWVAPFYVDERDPVAAEHPDWFLRTPAGELRVYRTLDGRRHFALDATHPGARDFVVTQLATLRAEGYRTFKLDFLFAGAIEGVRHEVVTALEAYQLWMRTIREALPDAHLLGCGAPQLPSVGWVDSMRIGPDIAYDALAPEPEYALYAGEARQIALRGSTDAWWALDPDVVLLRGERIDDVDAWSIVVSAALAGGNYLLGDGRQAGELRAAMALDREILALIDGTAARPRDVTAQMDPRPISIQLADVQGKTAVPHLWEKRSADAGRHWLAVFAWQDDPYRVELDLPRGAIEILPPAAPGTSSATVAIAGRQAIEVPRHAVRLFRW